MGKKIESSDDKVMRLMETVKKRRKSVGSLKKPQWTTPCSLMLPGMERITVQIEMDLGKLAMACGSLLRMKQDIEAASKELDVEISPKWHAYPIDDWIKDIKLRVRVLNIKKEQSKLAAMEDKLKTLTSPDQQRAMDLADIEAELE